MKRKILWQTLLVGLWSVGLFPLQTWAGWRTTIDGTDPKEQFYGDAAFAVTVDATGNVVAAGRVVNRDPILSADLDFAVVKLQGQDGAEV
jgi:hypothetical protein